jgi:Tfp pilus assembly protein PilV
MGVADMSALPNPVRESIAVRWIASRLRHEQRGLTIVEVLVSAVLVVGIAGGALGSLAASTRTSAEQRHRAQAHGVAQEDQARLRAKRVSVLANLEETRTVTVDETPYTVASEGNFVTDATGTASCQEGVASADYIEIVSTVSWPSMGSRPPAQIRSIVAPPNGSVSPSHGALAVGVVDGQGNGVPGVGLSGSGAGSFNGSTGANGCAIFGDLPEGTYTLTPSGEGLVDVNGEPPAPQTTSVVGLSTNTLILQYGGPGSIPVEFTTRVNGELVPSRADTIVAFNTGMSIPKTFGEIGTPATTITAESLFPFASPYTVYAGACSGNNPNPTGESDPPGAPAIANVTIPLADPAILQLPALHLRVWSGSGPGDPGSPVEGAAVTLDDQSCLVDEQPVRRTFTTDPSGGLPDPGLPWSTYDVCASDGATHAQGDEVVVQDLDSGTALDLYLAGALTGPCP